MSEVEVRSGLVGLADTLGFLHAEAGLAHCGLCPHVRLTLFLCPPFVPLLLFLSCLDVVHVLL